MTTVKNILNVYITNLNLYNAGILFGEWVDMTAPAEEITAVIEKISRNGDEIFITDFEGFIRHVGEYDSIPELKKRVDEITEALEGYTSEDVECIIDAVEQHAQYYSEQLEIIKNGNFRIFYDCYDMEDVAMQILEDDPEFEALPEIVKTYFDFKKYGINLEIEEHFYYTKLATYVQIFD